MFFATCFCLTVTLIYLRFLIVQGLLILLDSRLFCRLASWDSSLYRSDNGNRLDLFPFFPYMNLQWAKVCCASFFNVFWFFCFHRNRQLKKMNCKLYPCHLDPVWRGNVKFISFGRDLFWMCPPPLCPQPPSPLHCKMLGLWSQEEVGFLVESFLTFLMNVNLYYLTDYSWCKILSCV